MQSNSSKNPDEKNYSQRLKIEKEELICKDGFCSIPNLNRKTKVNQEDLNLFDPV